MTRTGLSIAFFVIGCGTAKPAAAPDLCPEAVAHVMAFVTAGAAIGSGEKAAMDVAAAASTVQCRAEGLSRAQADCILAAHPPDWGAQLRACPAFAAKPASWVILPPTAH